MLALFKAAPCFSTQHNKILSNVFIKKDVEIAANEHAVVLGVPFGITVGDTTDPQLFVRQIACLTKNGSYTTSISTEHAIVIFRRTPNQDPHEARPVIYFGHDESTGGTYEIDEDSYGSLTITKATT